MGTAKDNVLRFVFDSTYSFVIKLRNFYETYLAKMRSKIRKLVLLGLEPRVSYKKLVASFAYITNV